MREKKEGRKEGREERREEGEGKNVWKEW
jgi:hypothetical protein